MRTPKPAEHIDRLIRRIRPERVSNVLGWLEANIQTLPRVDVPAELPATEAATIQLYHWLRRAHEAAIPRLGGLWSTLSREGFDAMLAGSDERVYAYHPAIGGLCAHRTGTQIVSRREHANARVQVTFRWLSDAPSAHAMLADRVRRFQSQIPPALESMPDRADEDDLPAWLDRAVRRKPPRRFPAFVDAREAPPLHRPDRGALSVGAVAGLLKELYAVGHRALRDSREPFLVGPFPDAIRSFLTQESGEALSGWLLERWGDEGGYAAHRWCTLPLLVWPSADNTRRLGRIIDELRSRLNHAGVRFGVRLLEAIGDDPALALLARFAQHGSYAQSRDANAAIVEAARSRGLDRTSIDELAPLGMDDFDVDAAGVVRVPFGDEVTAEIDVTEIDRLRPRWRKGSRTLQRAPNGLKAAHPDPAERLDRLVRRLQRDVRREVGRLEQGLVDLTGRPWSGWRVYFRHRLLRMYVRGLLWHVRVDGRWVTCLADPDGEGTFHDLTGRRRTARPHEAVRLVHPADLAEDALEVWRDRLLERGLIQPVPQLSRRTFRGDGRTWLEFAGVWHDHLEHGIGRHLVKFHDEGRISLVLSQGYGLVGRWRASRARHWAVRAFRDGGRPPERLPHAEPPPPDTMPRHFVDPFAVWVDRLHFVHHDEPIAGHDVPPRLFSEVNLAIRHWDVGPASEGSP